MKFLTVNELSEILRISRTKLYQMTAKNELPCIRVGKRVLFKETVIDWLEKQSQDKEKVSA